MGMAFDSITPQLQEFIEKQHIFFVASAPLSKQGHVNVSPKDMRNFKVLGPHKVAYLDLTGSGNETSAHTLENGRITFMFCAFEGTAGVLRLYGIGRSVLPGDAEWNDLVGHFQQLPGARQIIVSDIAQASTACGNAVPFFHFAGDREELNDWAERKGNDGLLSFQEKHNYQSLDGLPTAMGLAAE